MQNLQFYINLSKRLLGIGFSFPLGILLLHLLPFLLSIYAELRLPAKLGAA